MSTFERIQTGDLKSNKSKLTSAVTSYKNNAYSDIKNYYSKAFSARNGAYDKKIAAADDKVKVAGSEYALKTKNAKTESTAARHSAYADYASKTSSSGTTADRLASANLSDSGYSEALRDTALDGYVTRISDIRKDLENAIASYKIDYDEAVNRGDAEKASIALSKANSAVSLEKQLVAAINGINKTVLSYEKQIYK